jgi:hypothetical protein
MTQPSRHGQSRDPGQCGLAYVAANTLGLQIYDLATPSAPVLRTTVPTVGDALGIAVTGGYAYLADFPATIDAIDLAP